MKEKICPYCDPEKFVVYGAYKKCVNEVNSPLMDFKIPIVFCKEQGSRMINDIMKNMKNIKNHD